MKYRTLGRTGLKVSELAIGGHEYRRWLDPYHFPGERNVEEFLRTQPQRNKLLERALDAGVNYFDTTFVEEAESLGLALKALGLRGVHISAMIISLFEKMKENPKSKWRDIVLEEMEERLKPITRVKDWILRPFRVDTGDVSLDEKLRGYRSVATDYREERVMSIE